MSRSTSLFLISSLDNAAEKSEGSLMYRFLFVFTVLILSPIPGLSQETASSKNSEMSDCATVCKMPPAQCHVERATVLLYQWTQWIDDCVLDETKKLSGLDDFARLESGIKELDLAIADPKGLDARLTLTDLLLEKANAHIAISHRYLRASNFPKAESEMESAATIFLSLFQQQKTTVQFSKSGPQIAEGLLHCGKPLEALNVLNSLPPDDAARNYLTAEAYYSIGEREAAATSYERWIAGGCDSKPVMLLHDDNGRDWGFLLFSKPTNQTKCEQLPQELRSRLEGLRDMFHHPNNIPGRSFPAIYFQDLAH